VGGTSLFRLVRAPAAPSLFDRLGRAGILVRRFAAEPTWLRFGLPGDEPQWRRLRAALAARVRVDPNRSSLRRSKLTRAPHSITSIA
jgi:cobalamin biosynthetic protein CobC